MTAINQVNGFENHLVLALIARESVQFMAEEIFSIYLVHKYCDSVHLNLRFLGLLLLSLFNAKELRH